MKILSLNELPWSEMKANRRRVFLRVDFNVPMSGGEISDDFRIRQSIPTIKALMEKQAVVVIGSHLGRPAKLPPEKKAKYSLLPVAERLAELLDHEVIFSEESVGSGVRKLIMDSRPGKSVILLENLRFHETEESNDLVLAEKLFENCDIYINDAFGACHRAHASIDAIVRKARIRAAGLLLEKEFKVLTEILQSPKKPQMAILGGAKIEGKIRVIERLMDSCQHIFIGGRMGLSFLAAQNISLGATSLEKEAVQMAKRLMGDARKKKIEFHFPVDVKAALQFDSKEASSFDIGQIPDGLSVFDIGPKTLDVWAQTLVKAKSIIWNGPMGVFENPCFSEGTLGVVDFLVAQTDKIQSTVGGGETVAAVTQRGALEKLYHVSTGGGAMLEFMEGKALPGLEALKLRDREIADIKEIISAEQKAAVV